MAFVGDLAGLFGHGTSGEGCDAEDLRLPGVQADLLEELLATGTPVVVVVVSGRPYALGAVHGRAAGLVQAFMPGEEGGARDRRRAVAGGSQPSGKLPVQIPRHPGGQPGTYLQPPLGAEHSGTSNLDPTPLFPFGHGRSYTTFAVDDLRISDREVADRRGVHRDRTRDATPVRGPATEVVQLYLHDVVAPVARPVRAADRVRPRLAGAGRGRSTSSSGSTPTGPRSPDRTCGGSSSRARSRSWSAPRPRTCRRAGGCG